MYLFNNWHLCARILFNYVIYFVLSL
jgi:hypothetical protein